MESVSIVEKAARAVITNSPERPSPDSKVSALLEREKSAKQNLVSYQLSELTGTWRLCFITGTKKARDRAGVVMGAGRYLPQVVKIQLSYFPSDLPRENNSDFEPGKVENSVTLGFLNFRLTGPVKLLSKRNILAFDFTKAEVKIFGWKIYDSYIRGGRETSDEKFFSERIGKQAFFAYFFVSQEAIAARGKGGGLAIWGKE